MGAVEAYFQPFLTSALIKASGQICVLAGVHPCEPSGYLLSGRMVGPQSRLWRRGTFLGHSEVEPRFLIEVLKLVTKSTKLRWLIIWYW